MNTGLFIEYGIGNSKLRHGMILGGGLIVFGLWILLLAGDSIPDRQLTAMAALTLGAGIALYAWKTGSGAGAVLRIDASGVWFRDWDMTVPWPEIGEIRHTGHRLQPFVSLRIRNPDGFLGSLPPGAPRHLKSGRLWKSPYIRIPNGSVDAPQPELLAVLRAALKEYG